MADRLMNRAVTLVIMVQVYCNTAHCADAPADPCLLQGRTLLFFGPSAADPLDVERQPPALRLRAKALLDAIAEGWRGNHSPLLIAGHVDAVERRAAQNLDLRRALAVKAALVQRGVQASALWTRGDTFDDPLLPDTTGPEIQNRYVSVLAPSAGIGCDGTLVR